ncbi:UDP-glucose 4-epimerase GalE [soil metagenome]
MTILVTGGAGYIGSHTVRLLRSLASDVVVLDSMEFGHREAIGDSELVVGNIRDRTLITELCRTRDITQIVHFAAYKAVGESMEQPGRYWLNNVAGTVDLVEAALAAGVREVVFSSSCAVNGTPESLPVDENSAIHPESVYAETKAVVERILGWYGITNDLRAVSLRYFNAAGASDDASIGEDWSRAQNLVPLVMKATLGKRGPVEVFGVDYPTSDSTCIRDYIHVDDLADAHVCALSYLGDGGKSTTLNLGTGVGTTVLEVIKSTERIAGREVPYTLSARRKGDPVATYADPSLAHATFGWSAKRTLDDIIESAWRWHSTHPDGY